MAKDDKTEETGLVVTGSTDVAEMDFGDAEGEGIEANMSDFLLPLISVLQALSPQVNSKERKVPGAVAGMFHDSSTDDLYDGEQGLLFVPGVKYTRRVEWKPRKARADGSEGELVDGRTRGGTWDPDHDEHDKKFIDDMRAVAKAKGRKPWDLRHPVTDNDVIETVYLYGLVVTHTEPEIKYVPAVVPISKTKLRVWRRFWGKLVRYVTPRGQKPPLWCHLWRLTTFDDKNNDGDEYKNLTVSPANGEFGKSLVAPGHVLYEAAKDFYDKVEAGLWRLDEDAEAGLADAAPQEAQTTPEEDAEAEDLF